MPAVTPVLVYRQTDMPQQVIASKPCSGTAKDSTVSASMINGACALYGRHKGRPMLR
jgi:hypothetical protein